MDEMNKETDQLGTNHGNPRKQSSVIYVSQETQLEGMNLIVKRNSVG
jgi:hypothetical protein